MQLVRGLHNLQSQARGCVVTIGNFDGVHRGHQAILARLRERAAELAVPSCVVIFEPQPREFFGPDTAPARSGSRSTYGRNYMELFRVFARFFLAGAHPRGRPPRSDA